MTTTRKRVVITGMGVLSSIGTDIASFKRGLLEKKVGIAPSDTYREYFDGAFASEIREPVDYPGLAPELIPKLDRGVLWGYRVGREALEDSGLLDSPLRRDTGLMIGVSAAGTEPFLPAMLGRPEEMNLDQVRYCGAYASISPLLASLLELGGGYELVATACTASPNAIGLAFDAIQNGKNEVMLAVGSEPLYIPTFAGFYTLKAMADGSCSPFSGEAGMSVGEGAGALVLEEYEHAKARGATIYGELLAYATTGDAYHETAPDPKAEGSSCVMNFALRNAGLEPAAIEYVNAHGTGTEANDRSETLALKKVFGEGRVPPLSSTKSYFGHSIGAAGILELIACLVTLPDGQLLPTLNFSEARSYCDLDYIPNEFRAQSVNVFMKNNYAFGGDNCCMILANRAGSVPASTYDPRRVVITGLGSVSSLGLGNAALAAGLDAGGANPAKGTLKLDKQDMEGFDQLPSDENGQLHYRYHAVTPFNARKILRNADTRKLNSVSTYALTAMELAFNDAGYKVPKSAREVIGLIMGTSKGPSTTIQKLVDSLTPDPNNVRTKEFAMSLMNSIATQCSIAKGIKGYNTTLATGYGASIGALIQGYEVIRQNLQPLMVVGGADESAESISTLMHLVNDAISHDMDAHAYRVYDRDLPGYFIGEGAGCMLLESVESAAERGARVYAEVAGYGRRCEPIYFNDHAGQGEPMAAAIDAALAEAGIGAAQLDLVCGTSWGGEYAPLSELRGIKKALGEAAGRVPLTNFNGYFGFVEAAGGLLNLNAAVHCMQESLIYPIRDTQEFAVEGLNYVTGEPQRSDIRHLLLTGLSEGGNCYAVVIKRAP